MKKRRVCTLLLIVLSVLSLLLAPAAGASADLPAEPAEFNTNVEAPSFTMTAAGGQVLTSENFGAGRNLLLVYGRVYCGNTQAFLGGIQDQLNLLKANGVTVLVGLFDDPSDELMNDFSEYFGGVLCAKVSNDYYESGMWAGLNAVGAGSGSVTFPVIFLRSSDGRLLYYSTDYVYEPLSIVAAAVVMGRQHPTLEKTADLRLPEDLTTVQAYAFQKGKYTSVYCGENVTSIGAYAFANNTALQWIWLPPSVTSIDNTAFSGCPASLVIYGKSGSYAQKFAKANGYKFEAR